MIKALIFACLISITLCQVDYNVRIFRGQLNIINGKFNVNEMTIQGITVKEYTLVGIAQENEQAYLDIFYKSGNNLILPSRNLSTIRLRPNTPSALGVVLQSKFTSDNGDVFDINIAFPLCSNDFVVSEFTAVANAIEEKRQRNSAELAKYFATLKESSSTYILQTETLANLIDDKVDNETKLEELRRVNAELENQMADLEKALIDDEAAELVAERKAAKACLNTKISNFSIQVAKNNKKVLLDHRDVLKEQLSAGISLTDEDSRVFNEKYQTLVEAIASYKKLNSNIQDLKVEKGKAVATESLTPYFFK
jgi:hypothetical protein